MMRRVKGRMAMMMVVLLGVLFSSVSTAGALAPMKYFGGEVANNPHLSLIFGGSNWNEHGGTRNDVTKMFSYISGSGWQRILTQYYDESGYISENVGFDYWTDESIKAPHGVNDAQLEHEIEYAISQRGWPCGGGDQIHMILPAPGTGY